MAKRLRPIDQLPTLSIPVHRLADQQYCEMKAHLQLFHPDIGSRLRNAPKEIRDDVARRQRSRVDGKVMHAKIAASAVRVAGSRIKEHVRAQPPLIVAEQTLFGDFRGLPLIGQPDAIYFDGHDGACIIDYKRGPAHMTPSHDVQLRTYGYLLEQTMQQMKSIMLACTFIPPLGRTNLTALANAVVATIPARTVGWTKQFVAIGASRARAAFFAYDRMKIRDELSFLSGYWLGKRAPIPTKRPAKCQTCEMNAAKLCPTALAAYAPK